jgi:hypothetical protein
MIVGMPPTDFVGIRRRSKSFMRARPRLSTPKAALYTENPSAERAKSPTISTAVFSRNGLQQSFDFRIAATPSI